MTIADLELESPSFSDSRWATLDEQKQQLEQDAQKYAGKVQEVVRSFLGSIHKFEDACKHLWREALAGKAVEVQKERERLLTAFLHRLFLLNKVLTMARHAEHVARRTMPEAEQLEAEAQSLDLQLARLMVRWQTPEDLEDLAAESRAPSREQLRAMQAALPVQTWSQEDSKPF